MENVENGDSSGRIEVIDLAHRLGALEGKLESQRGIGPTAMVGVGRIITMVLIAALGFVNWRVEQLEEDLAEIKDRLTRVEQSYDVPFEWTPGQSPAKGVR